MMYRRRVGMTARQLYTEYVSVELAGWALLVLVVFFLLGCAGFGLHIFAQNADRTDNAAQQSHLVSLFGGAVQHGVITWPHSAEAVAYRKRVATNLLTESYSVQSQYMAPFLTTHQLNRVAASGTPPSLANPQIVANFGSYINWTAQRTLPTAGILFVLLVWALYGLLSFKNREQLIDLPWRKWWVYPFVLVTLPTALPFYVVSFVRGLWLRHITPDVELRLVDMSANLPHRLRSKQTVGEARRAYLKFRGSRFFSSQQASVDRLRAQVASGERELDRLEDRSESLQRQLPWWRRDLGEATAALSLVQAEELSPTAHAAEFEQLLQLPGVVSIEVNDKLIKLFIGPVIVQLAGRYFDLGDYWIQVLAGSDELPTVNCVRNTCRRHYGHPYHEGDGGFCFGNRNAILQRQQSSGDVTVVASLVVESLFYVNPEDEASVMKRYPEVHP